MSLLWMKAMSIWLKLGWNGQGFDFVGDAPRIELILQGTLLRAIKSAHRSSG